ncbi:MAG TPA: NAD(P)-dependent oxidoreductase [Verrucomicrobiota bacterium]|nr:NAD(P)-dependent oxidoreductase [Verrucomicrobiota bacterium]HRT57060.1 NAD(P)-dependent oxidoreductase [Candidatus Paceibacterota bacterium]
MKILFTGASSFTGFWFVKALRQAGADVVCALTGRVQRYQGLRSERVKLLQDLCRFVPDAPFGSESFLELARNESWDLLCHHGAEVTDYRSPDFDPVKALAANARNARMVLAALGTAGLKGLVLTGSVFENDEGLGNEPLRAFSPYGLSKGLTYQLFRFYCDRAGVALGKFVIPNPFGPYEEARFTAYLMRQWQAGNEASVKTPLYIRDNIPVDLLAAAYAQFCARVAANREGLLKFNPSGYVENQGAFALRVAREVAARTGWSCNVRLERQQDFAEPLMRLNGCPAASLVPEWSETAFWDSFVAFYKRG